MLHSQNIAIIGFSREGKSALSFLRKDPRYKNAEITILDRNKIPKAPKNTSVVTGEEYLENLDQFDIIIRSPGIYYKKPEIQKAIKAGRIVTSATKIFFEKCPAPIIGITGSKGKTTTVSALYHILKKAKYKVYLAGNIGTPALDILPKLTKKSWVILELSSFQLQDTTISPHIAGITEIFPDHLDVHKNMAEYQMAKTNIIKHQKENDAVFYFPHNKGSKKIALASDGKKYPVEEKGYSVQSDEIRVPGTHSLKNINMACAIAHAVGVSKETIKEALKTFRGVPHRLESIKRIKTKEKQTITFYNDSAATNPTATAAAITAFTSGENFLLAGGHDKNLSVQPLVMALSKSKAHWHVLLYGENRKKLADAIKKVGKKITVTEYETLEEAVRDAWKEAKHSLQSTINIVLSPASASFDQFKSYVERAETFKKAVTTVTKK